MGSQYSFLFFSSGFKCAAGPLGLLMRLFFLLSNLPVQYVDARKRQLSPVLLSIVEDFAFL